VEDALRFLSKISSEIYLVVLAADDKAHRRAIVPQVKTWNTFSSSTFSTPFEEQVRQFPFSVPCHARLVEAKEGKKMARTPFVRNVEDKGKSAQALLLSRSSAPALAVAEQDDSGRVGVHDAAAVGVSRTLKSSLHVFPPESMKVHAYD
jgi:hypothetical protein